MSLTPQSKVAPRQLADRVIDSAPGHEVTIRGAGFYRDEYRKRDDGWKISHTGYVRTFAEIESRAGAGRDLRLTATTQGVLRPPAGPGR